MQDLQPVSRASSHTMLVGRLQSATTITRLDSADLPELTDPETIHKVVKKIRGMYGSCSTGDSQDVMHMLGSIQVGLSPLQLCSSMYMQGSSAVGLSYRSVCHLLSFCNSMYRIQNLPNTCCKFGSIQVGLSTVSTCRAL